MSSSAKRAVILGGTGAIGGATALRLAERGWTVDVTGRDPERMPEELVRLGVRFHATDRSDALALSRLIGDGSDLLVDLVAYSADDVAAALPAFRDSRSIVVVSSRAVYMDPDGRHINGDEPPRFPVPIAESAPTLPPAAPGTSPFTREGYAPSKVAMEHSALESGAPVTVIRPSKVHGRWARNARTSVIVRRMREGENVLRLRRARAVDHLTAAANTAALIETVADVPAARILNSADPDALSATEIVEAIGEAISWPGRVVPVADDHAGLDHPWAAAHPIVLDTTAAVRLGYRPVGTGRALLAEEARWVAETLRS